MQRCLESIDRQSYPNIEIIQVDRYSTDRTYEIASRYVDLFICMGRERNEQLSEAILSAHGKYVLRVDSDFTIPPDLVAKAVKLIEQSGADFLIVNNSFPPSDVLLRRVRKVERDIVIANPKYHTAGQFWRRDALLAVGMFDADIYGYEEYHLNGKLLKAGYKFAILDVSMVHLGEPDSLQKVVRSSVYVGKNAPTYLRKDRKGVLQIQPLRVSYLKSLNRFGPLELLYFLVYKYCTYVSATIGMLIEISKES